MDNLKIAIELLGNLLSSMIFLLMECAPYILIGTLIGAAGIQPISVIGILWILLGFSVMTGYNLVLTYNIKKKLNDE
jgi:hypothetical protein